MADVISVLDEIIAQYQPGGGYAASRGQQQKTAEKKATAGKQQALVGGGLAGTTVAASVPSAVFEEISQPFQTETELIRTQALMDAYTAKAGYLQEQERLAQEKDIAEQQIAADKYSSSMAAAARAHGGGGGGGSPGGGAASSLFGGAFTRQSPQGGGGYAGPGFQDAWSQSDVDIQGLFEGSQGYSVNGRYHAPAGYGQPGQPYKL